MAVKFLRATADRMPSIRDLANQVFRSRRPGDMAIEFPHLYAVDNASHWFCAVDGDRVISIIGVFVWPARVLGSCTTVATLGSVATDPAYRRQGWAGRLLQWTARQLRLEGVRLVIISGDLPLYQRFGARPVGYVQWWRLTQPALGTVDSYSVRTLDPFRDAGWAAMLYQGRKTRLVRAGDLWPRLLAADPLAQVERGRSRPFMVEQHGVPVTYALFLENPQHGSDTSRLTEWAGDPVGLLAAAAAVQHTGRGVLIPVLEEDMALRTVLRQAQAEMVKEGPFPYLAKIIDGAGWFDDLADLYDERGLGDIEVAEGEPDHYEIRFNGLMFQANGAQLTRWCLGPLSEWPTPPADRLHLPGFWPEGLIYV
mgnify:CR=1 FL=1